MKNSLPRHSVVLIEPHEGLRCFLRTLVNQTPDLYFAGEAANANEAMEMAAAVPDFIVIASPWLPHFGVFHLASVIEPGRLILYVDALPSQTILRWAFNQGASVVSGIDPVDEVSNALKSACSGSTYYSSRIRNTPGFVDRGNGQFRSPVLAALAGFSAKQMSILVLYAQGQRVREIADSMDMSYKAIDSQLYRIRKALCVNDRVELAHFCLREGLIRIPGLQEKSPDVCAICGDRSAVGDHCA